MLKDDLKSLVLNTLWSVNSHREQFSHFCGTETQLLLLISVKKWIWSSGWAGGSLTRASAGGFGIPRHCPSPSQVPGRGSSSGLWGKQDWFPLCSGVPGVILGVSSAPAVFHGGEWWQLCVCVTALGCSGITPACSCLTATHCLPHTEGCLSKPDPGKMSWRFFRPSATDRRALFHFLLVFATLALRLSSSHQCHCQRSCVIPVGKLPKFLQALGSCYYGSKSKLCLG